jgi:hypothetical protein
MNQIRLDVCLKYYPKFIEISFIFRYENLRMGIEEKSPSYAFNLRF